MTMRRGARRSAAAARSRRPPGQRHVTIPAAAELRGHYQKLTGYRLLVEVLKSSPFKAIERFRELPSAESKALFHLRIASRESRRDHRMGSSFVLALAWVLMDRENQKATRDPRVASVVSKLTRTWNCKQAILLQQSYLPQEVDELLRLYLEAVADSRKEANQLRQYRGLVEYNQPIPPELHEAELMPTDQMRRWAKRFGFDKESGTLSRQELWDWITRPLMATLLEGHEKLRQRERRRARDEADVKIPKAASWRAAARDVFDLLHARYPDLPLPTSELIRKRYCPD